MASGINSVWLTHLREGVHWRSGTSSAILLMSSQFNFFAMERPAQFTTAVER